MGHFVHFKDIPIAFKMILLCLMTSIASLFLAAIIIIAYDQYSFKKVLGEEISVLGSIISNRSQAAVVFGDNLLAATNLKALATQSTIQYACLYAYDEDSRTPQQPRLFAKYLSANDFQCPDQHDVARKLLKENIDYQDSYIDVITAIPLDDKIIGHLIIRSSLATINKRLLDQSLVSIGAMIIAGLVALLLAMRLEKLISSPLLKLGNTARKIAEQEDYSLRANKDGEDEVGQVVDSFNYMLTKIEHEDANLRASEEKFRVFSESSSVGIFQTDANGRCIYANDRLSEICGASIDDILRDGWLANVFDEDKAKLQHQWDNCLKRGSSQRFDCRYSASHTELNWVTGHISPISDDLGQALGFLGTVSDVTALKQAQSQLEHLAFYDMLTGLANRRLFRDRLENLLEQVNRHHSSLALLFIDIDHFKNTNDTLGHDAGDALLRIVADRLHCAVRAADTVARLGGDEFTIILSDTKDEMAVSHIADNLIKDISKPISLGDNEVSLTASIGIAMAPENGNEAEALIKHADLALYKAKDEGRNNFQFFNEEMNTRLMEHLELMRDLRKAMINDEFCLHYQPQLSLDSKQVIGFEALIRWISPERGFVSPLDFIPAAEESGQIIPLGKWILRTACQKMKALLDAKLIPEYSSMAVNLSVKQLTDDTLVTTVQEVLKETGIAPYNLDMEITESMLMENMETAVEQLSALRDLGISISIDDFGTGYSSLGYLKSLPVHIVKVDRSFVQDIPQDTDDMAITAAVIAMAHKLNYKVVAEGIETVEQLHFLEGCQCDYGQGFFFSRPLPEDQLNAFLIDHSGSASINKQG
jgi:diguanylate cyclase (GGDEF)-like protein/PAS domain S-box-containing protein